jgi:hypothetical protein
MYLEETTGPALKIMINKYSFEIPASWNILVVDEETMRRISTHLRSLHSPEQEDKFTKLFSMRFELNDIINMGKHRIFVEFARKHRINGVLIDDTVPNMVTIDHDAEITIETIRV